MRQIITMALTVVATLAISCEDNKNEYIVEPTTPSTENFEELYAQGWEQRDDQTARLTLAFGVSEESISRATTSTEMERNVADVNLYLYNTSMGISQHIFLDSDTSLTLPITPGTWDVYAIANLGVDMGDMTQTEVASVEYRITSESDLYSAGAFVMSYNSQLTISTQTSLDIVLSRAVARVDVNLSVLSSDITIQTIRLVNATMSQELFNLAEVTPLSSNLMSYDYRVCSDGSTVSFYMLENRSGTNTNITDESDKNSNNAPATAAYIEITGETSEASVKYYIYLGANNTYDFNVCRNTIYEIDASIYGTNSNDLRVEVSNYAVSTIASLVSGHAEIYSERNVSDVLSTNTVDLSVTAKIEKALQYDVVVLFEPLWWNESEGEYISLTYAALSPWEVSIPAGATQATDTITYITSINLLTHVRLVEVQKVSDSDENSYYVDTAPLKCTSNTTSVVYY